MLGVPLAEVTGELREIGKAQPVDTPVLTPSGWRLMGELQAGDQVIGGDGHPVKVLGVFPQGRKQVYRVTSSDGAVTECCAEHLWTVRNHNTKNDKWQTRELSYLMEHGLRNKGSRYQQPKYELPPLSGGSVRAWPGAAVRSVCARPAARGRRVHPAPDVL